MKIAATGYPGNVANELVRRGIEPISMDITNAEETKAVILSSNPDILIHCAALTDVDECETYPKKAFNVNVNGVRNILDWYNGTFIYLSTDHVFDGGKNWVFQFSERHRPNPINIYGLTKYAGEAMCRTAIGDYYIIRTSRLFNYPMMSDDIMLLRDGSDKDFTTLINRSFLHINHFVDSLFWFVDNLNKMPKLLHIAGSDTMSYYLFWLRAAKILGIDENLVIARNYEIEASPRPFKGGLDISKAKNLGMPVYSDVDGLKLVKEGI